MGRPRKRDKHLPANMYYRGKTYFFVRGGKWHPLGHDLAGAMIEYGRMLAEPKGGMAELIDKALDAIKPRIAESTHKQYVVAARKIKKAFVEFAPEQVKPKHVAAFKVSMVDHPSMANRCLTLLRVVFSQAVEWQIIDSNPASEVKKLAQNQRDRYLNDAELSAIYSKAGPRLQVIIDLCFLTGQRISDVLAIRYADMTDEGISFKQRKTGARLTVRWSPELRAAVERAKTLYGNVRAFTLIQSKTGKPPSYSTVWEQWQAACEAAGIEDANIHDLRAKSITDANEQGLDPQAIAGHTSRAMTERYIRIRRPPVVTGPNFGKKRG